MGKIMAVRDTHHCKAASQKMTDSTLYLGVVYQQ